MKLYSIENFLTDKECDKIIAHIDEYNEPSRVSNDDLIDGGLEYVYRNSTTSNLYDNIIPNLRQRIADELQIQNLKKGEGLQGQKYEPGQYFKSHTDFFEGEAYQSNCLTSGNRTHTLMIYLNEDFEGGQTYYEDTTTIKPVLGRGLFFNGVFYKHGVNKVEKNTRYVVATWYKNT